MKQPFFLQIITVLLVFTGCSNFLDEKPNKSSTVPENLKDLQALLDDYTVLMQDPTAGEISSDDYYLTYEGWSSLSQENHRRLYTWEKDYLFASTLAPDWFYPYRVIYRANLVLDFLSNINPDPNKQNEWNNVKGQALFLRARGLLSVVTLFAGAYDETTSTVDLGVPIRMNINFNEPSVRANVKETYSQITNDLLAAKDLLAEVPVHVSRPGKPATLALLARVYLYMHDYNACFTYANESLNLKKTLMNYNLVSSGNSYPFVQFNDEVLYDTYLPTPQPLNISRAKTDSTLYRLYEDNDLRKTLFFRVNGDNTVGFRGSYEGSTAPFSGIAVDEVYLMRAECSARFGDVANAMSDLNELLMSRWKITDGISTYIPYQAGNASEALIIILKERRKELLMRNLRWADIKRLNKEGANISLLRNLNGREYRLPPNDLRFALAIPEDVISQTGMIQNSR